MATYTIRGKEDSDPSNQPIRATLTVDIDDGFPMTLGLWRDLWREIGEHFQEECSEMALTAPEATHAE